MEIGLSLGSNMNDRMANLQAGRDRLAQTPEVEIVDQSPVYETDPVDVRPEHVDKPFLNAVVIVGTRLPVETVAKRCHEAEAELGRERSEDRNAPRPLDIDVIYANGLELTQEGLRVPHPRWRERRFVAQPLADLRPVLRLPGEKRTVQEVLDHLPATPAARLFVHDW